MATSFSSDQTTLQKDTGAASVMRAARTRITSIQAKGIAGSVLTYMIQLQQVQLVQVI